MLSTITTKIKIFESQAMPQSARWTEQQYQSYLKQSKTQSPDAQVAKVSVNKTKTPKMTTTEMEYERIYLRGIPHKFQPFTFHMQNGLKYRPDFYIPEKRTFIEVKGCYRLPSHGRSMLAYNQCRVEFPEFLWQMATKTKSGWNIR